MNKGVRKTENQYTQHRFLFALFYRYGFWFGIAFRHILKHQSTMDTFDYLVTPQSDTWSGKVYFFRFPNRPRQVAIHHLPTVFIISPVIGKIAHVKINRKTNAKTAHSLAANLGSY